MAMHEKEILDLLRQAFPDAELQLLDLVGDKDHYRLTIKDRAFKDLSLVAQHRMVYQALGNCVGNRLHALQLTTEPI